MTEISAKEVYVTHRTTPSEELRGLKGLWQYLITRSQLKAKIEIAGVRKRPWTRWKNDGNNFVRLIEYAMRELPKTETR